MTGEPLHADVHANARALLRDHYFPAATVIAVHPDSILYVTRSGQARTAWMHADPRAGTVLLRAVAGFPAHPPHDFPPASLRPRIDLEDLPDGA